MPTLNYQSSYGKNLQTVLPVSQFVSEYLQGINFVDRNNQPIPYSTFETHLKNSISYLENYLAIKILKQVIEEDREFNRTDWSKWGFVKTTYFVACVSSMDGYIGAIRQVQYPKDWLTVKKTNDQIGFHKHINVIPNQSAYVQNMGVAFQGLYPHLGYLNSQQIPNYWKCTYVTGWDSWQIPNDILFCAALLSTIGLLTFLSTGMNPFFATASQSISIDGLSQSLSSIQNSNSLLFSPLIKQSAEMLNGSGGKPGMLENLRSIYGDFSFTVA